MYSQSERLYVMWVISSLFKQLDEELVYTIWLACQLWALKVGVDPKGILSCPQVNMTNCTWYLERTRTIWSSINIFRGLVSLRYFMRYLPCIWYRTFLSGLQAVKICVMESIQTFYDARRWTWLTKQMCFKQEGSFSTANVKHLKLEDEFTYLGSNISATENDVNMRLEKVWTVINRLSII